MRAAGKTLGRPEARRGELPVGGGPSPSRRARGRGPRSMRSRSRWPSGRVDRHAGLDADAGYLLREGSPKPLLLEGWPRAPPKTKAATEPAPCHVDPTSTSPPEAPADPGRIGSMDQFRGYTVAGMCVVNFLGGLAAVHPVLKHNNNYFSYADSIMPSFMFACGFSYRLSALRRLERVGPAATYRRFVARSLGLVLVSLMMYGFGDDLQVVGRDQPGVDPPLPRPADQGGPVGSPGDHRRGADPHHASVGRVGEDPDDHARRVPPGAPGDLARLQLRLRLRPPQPARRPARDDRLDGVGRRGLRPADVVVDDAGRNARLRRRRRLDPRAGGVATPRLGGRGDGGGLRALVPLDAV